MSSVSSVHCHSIIAKHILKHPETYGHYEVHGNALLVKNAHLDEAQGEIQRAFEIINNSWVSINTFKSEGAG